MHRLKELRRNSKKSQADIAKILGVTFQAYSNYETNKREIGTDMAAKLADYYGVSMEYLLGKNDTQITDTIFSDSTNVLKELEKKGLTLDLLRNLSSSDADLLVKMAKKLAGKD